MSDATRPASRPLSPHLSIYRPYLTMVMSIAHRITGTALYFGILILAWWLVAAATGPEAFSVVSGFLDSWFGRLILVGFSWAFFHHMLGGIRHLIWDTIHGFGKRERDLLALATLIGSLTLTVVFWLVVALI